MEDKIEEPISDQRTMSDHLNDAPSSASLKRRKGGLITMPFIIANEAFEKVASYGLVPNMILYFIGDYHLSVAKGTNILFFWTAATNFMPILGAFLSDSYLGRFLTIGLGSIVSLLGTILLWLTAMIPKVKPPPCDMLLGQKCQSPTASQMTLLISSFILMAIGAGGIRPLIILDGESGFGVPAILMFLSAFLFFLASPLYIKMQASTSLFTGFAQVAVVAYKNRKLPLPPPNSTRCYHRKKGSEVLVPTKKLRFLNKACIIRNPEQDIAADGSASNPWRLCTIEQVEELKALLKVIPLWSTGIMMSINISQNSFPVLQASSMDRHITSSFQIPAGSFGMFTVIALAIWVVLYDRAILPLASKIKGKPVRLGVKLRMGIGLFLSCLGMVVSGIVENARRRKAIREGYLNNPRAVLDMSAMWLIPQHLLNGFAEAFNAIGQTEFYYSEFPKSMSSIASALFGLGMAVANLLASLIVSTVNDLTSKGGKESWVSSNINKGHYDNYYWLLAILSLINMIYFLACSWAYGPCVERIASANVEGNGIKGGRRVI
ncbi:hypothetical protein Patl1_34254 [Pistacia atlantica]|uniref:Uncharacterized protein n=1 Tax=Pistacia atlantica TaxID=434234 RepID=A0ACC0ZRP7_9ROSI|nr:hypothetical protein Patl1_34254 [Pistacia atlantica]